MVASVDVYDLMVDVVDHIAVAVVADFDDVKEILLTRSADHLVLGNAARLGNVLQVYHSGQTFSNIN